MMPLYIWGLMLSHVAVGFNRRIKTSQNECNRRMHIVNGVTGRSEVTWAEKFIFI